MKIGNDVKHKITIEPTSNGGFYVKVGCATAAFSGKEDLLEGFKAFIEKPDVYMKLYSESGVPLLDCEEEARPERVRPLASYPRGRTAETDDSEETEGSG